MNPGLQSVQPDEFILRRVHKNHVNPSLPPTVHFLAFRPNRGDTAGLSVYRERDVSPDQVAAAGRKSGEYYVVRIAVRELHALGLTVVLDEQPDGPPGHALIPELSVASCVRDKQRWRAVQVRLAELASQAIVRHATT